MTIIHRRDRLRADAILQERALKHEKMAFIWDTVVEEIVGDTAVTHLRLKNVKSGESSVFPVDGVFVFIGHKPNTELFAGQVQLDETGYIETDRRTHTNVPGVLACGDVQDSIYRQAITAAASGCTAAIEAEKYIAENEGRAYPSR